ncbi:hypothetical protein [Nitratireductor pacificus]|uniref:Uncharacterized protein n=1 Tax=Nitratireductor pacificus pht-3B TaxID=391937 RepID=K2M816_9HYPH|nr:hypothetical protein [Nitratireductor pacificus]EKF17095.1 hypothetical protein NA2_20033 [Nitratireductor pacificus pht-3B]
MIELRRADAAPLSANLETDPVRRMADAMLHIAGGGRTVDRDAIALMGFSAAEIDRYGVEARDLANARQSGRQSGPDA